MIGCYLNCIYIYRLIVHLKNMRKVILFLCICGFSCGRVVEHKKHYVVLIGLKNIPKQATSYLESWSRAGFENVIVGDEDCNRMMYELSCQGYFRPGLYFNVKADMCRYAALYFNGGVYSDLDVKLLKDSYDFKCHGLCTTNDAKFKTRIGSHLFSAKKHSSCLMRVIKQVCRNAKHMDLNFKTNPHLSHKIAGPDAFHDSAVSCSVMKWGSHLNIYEHAFASRIWGDGYPSWVKVRMRLAGWKTIDQE